MDKRDGPVLVAVDFSGDSYTALNWAIDYADRIGAPLTIVHVVHDPAGAPGYYQRDKEDLLLPLEEVAKERFDEFLGGAKKECPKSAALEKASIVLVRGLPANRILAVAEEIEAAHIVVGCQGRTGLPHLLVGSVAQRVVQLSPTPVTVVKSKNSTTKEPQQ